MIKVKEIKMLEDGEVKTLHVLVVEEADCQDTFRKTIEHNVKLQAEIDALARKLKTERDELHRLSQENRDLQTRKIDHVVRLQKALENHKHELGAKESRIKILEQTLRAEQQAYRMVLAEKESQITNLMSFNEIQAQQIQGNQASIKSLDTTIQTLGGKINACHTIIDTRDMMIKSLETTIQELQAKNTSLSKTITHQEQRIKDLSFVRHA